MCSPPVDVILVFPIITSAWAADGSEKKVGKVPDERDFEDFIRADSIQTDCAR